jgi:ribonuclease J
MENIEIKQDTTYIFALGGIGEIGKNMYVVQHNKEIYIIDCGIKFANEDELPGVNGIICSFDYLIENKEKIKGLIITHAHEDHIGGIPYLLKKISNIKIYGAKLTLGIIKKKLKEHERSLLPHTEQIIDDNTVLNSSEFKIEFFRVCHSIPDSFGVYLETKAGKIISTGDFRFDFGNRGDETDILKIARLAERNIDVLLCESTNAEREGFSPSESTIINQLKRIILKAKGRIILSTFASNLGRVEEIIEIAINNNRKVCMCGRSMNTNIETSIECGFLQVNKNCFVEQREIKDIPDEQLLILSTGSQGEEMAALNRMSNGKHP